MSLDYERGLIKDGKRKAYNSVINRIEELELDEYEAIEIIMLLKAYLEEQLEDI